MTALNKHFLISAAVFLLCLPAAGQETGSADQDLRKAEVLHGDYRFREAGEYYRKALEQTSDSILKIAIADKILQCANGESLLQFIVRPEAVASRTFSTNDFFLYLNDLKDKAWIPVPNPFIKISDRHKNPFYTAMYFPSGENSTVFSAPDETGAWNLCTSTRKDSTVWSVPEILSSNILSGRNEIFPILSRDGRTLYFASDGMPGMGGYDLFYSRLDEETGEWSTPENMGFPYSSTGNDILYMESRDGKYSIIVSDRETSGDSVTIYVTDYIATPVRTAIGRDESPRAIASFRQQPAETAGPEAGDNTQVQSGHPEMTDYSRLMHRLRELQEEHREKLAKIEESRRIYESASEEDRKFLAGIIQDVEKETMQIKRQMDGISAQIQDIELKFLAEGIIPTVEEEPEKTGTADTDTDRKYTFSRHSMGRIPYIIVEVPEPKFDYSFKILGRNEGQFAEDNTLPSGIVYQIQFMVLSNHASVKDIRGMSPVFVTKLKSGKYLHTVGLFTTYDEALGNLGKVRKNGFPEAFIIAYNNGSSISVKNARAMEGRKQSSASASSGDISYQVVFKGYGSSLPSSITSTIRQTTDKDITKSVSEGETVFAVGPFPDRNDAEFLLKILQDLDIKNVSIESIKL